MSEEIPKVIALAYYDGATEGFLNGLNDDQVYFFKVVAWDQDQDRRLYLLGRPIRAAYAELIEILEETGQRGSGSTWIPRWVFESAELAARANILAEMGRSSLQTPAFLAMGGALPEAMEIVFMDSEALAKAVALATQGTPGDLAAWPVPER